MFGSQSAWGNSQSTSSGGGSGGILSVNGQTADLTGNVSIAIPDALSDLSSDATHRTVTDTEKSTWNGKQNALVAGTDYLTPHGDGSGLNGVVKSETDPVFVASPAHAITSGNITNWNAAYGWGNHAAAGYLTGITGVSIKDLSDVNDAMLPTAGQALVWDAVNSRWTAGTVNGGGGQTCTIYGPYQPLAGSAWDVSVDFSNAHKVELIFDFIKFTGAGALMIQGVAVSGSSAAVQSGVLTLELTGASDSKVRGALAAIVSITTPAVGGVTTTYFGRLGYGTGTTTIQFTPSTAVNFLQQGSLLIKVYKNV